MPSETCRFSGVRLLGAFVLLITKLGWNSRSKGLLKKLIVILEKVIFVRNNNARRVGRFGICLSEAAETHMG